LLILGIQTSVLAQTPAAEGLTWYTDLAKAREISDAQKIPIFAFFTGSDWCGWCHKLQADTLEVMKLLGSSILTKKKKMPSKIITATITILLLISLIVLQHSPL
jgi:hypothetical protein